jgi:hypothetical protein
MNLEMVEKVANAVLYEGYLLYPYTSSAVKNQKRWNFGVLHPPGFDTSEMQTEALAEADRGATIRVKVRFLQESACGTIERQVELRGEGEQPFQFSAAAEIRGSVELSVTRLGARLVRVTARIRNLTEAPDASPPWCMLSTHTILSIEAGAFVSLMDPPAEYREAASSCRNVGTWPVLAGSEGERAVMLSSPIILYDYPQIASESPGDLFDSTEIDEILSLRIMTLSDEEKAEIRAGDEHARRILERTESLPPEQFQKLHGALRGLARPKWYRKGERVLLHPKRRADIFDIALAGRVGIIEAVEQDFEGRVQLAVVLEDDPGRDLGEMRQPGHRFFFTPEEVEPVP